MKTRTMMGLLGLFLFLTAFAAAPAAAEGKGPILVWGVSAVTDIPEDQVSAIASWLPGEVQRTTGLDVVDEDVIDEGIDLAMDNGECRENNMACVVEVARALWVSEAVYGDIGVINGVYILTLRRVDASSGKVIKQVSAQTNQGVDVLIQSMSDMIATLYDIPHNQVGTVRALGRNDGYDYVIVTYGPWFSWVEPVVWYHYYPWWWSGSIHYYHHHHAWWRWHHRHPHGRPYYHGPRREYPHRDHHRGHHDGHGGDKGHDGGNLERPSDAGAGQKGHRLDSDRKVGVRPAVRPAAGVDAIRPSRFNQAISTTGNVDRPAVSPRPGKDVVAPKGTMQRPQPQRREVQKPYQPRQQVRQPDARPGNSNRAPAVNRPSNSGSKPAVRGGSVGSQSNGKKKSSGSSNSSGPSKPSSGKSKSSGKRGIGGGAGTDAKPAGTRGGR